MTSGMFNRQITVEKKSVTKDSLYGTDIVSWIPLVALAGSPVVGARFAAQVLDVLPSRSEAVQQGLELARNQTRIRVRYRGDINSDMRIVLHGDADVIYAIVGGPSTIGRKEMIEMVCERYSS